MVKIVGVMIVMIINYSIICLLLIPNIDGETESTNTDTNIETSDYKEDKKRSTASDYWRNHKYYTFGNNLYNRESKSNNEPYFTEPNSETYEAVPSSLQISAMPGGGYGGGYGSPYGPYGGFGGNEGYHNQQKFPVFVINKAKDNSFKWIALLILLGLPLLGGLIFIPLILQTIFFLFTIFRNLGMLLPLIPAITGNAVNPLVHGQG